MSLEKILVQYGLDLKELRNDFATLKTQLDSNEAAIKKSANEATTAYKGVGSTIRTSLVSEFKNLAATVGVAFAVQKAVSFTSEVLKLANAAKDVRETFEAFGDPTLLTRLRSSVKGTLDDVTLMQKAISARNLQIPIQNLAKLFEFAKLRADQTNGSTQALIDTIINGIGTKSTRALVQVGISQNAFNAEVKKTGDYFSALSTIIDTELSEAGEQVEDTGDKVEQLNASILNLKTSIGNQLLPAQEKLLTGFSLLIEVIKAGPTPMQGLYANIQKDINESFKTGANVVSAFNRFVDENAGKYKTLEEAAAAYNATAIEYIRNVKDAGIESEAAAKILDEQYSSYQRQIAIISKYVISQQAETSATEEGVEATENATQAIDEQKDSLEALSNILKIVGRDIRDNNLVSARTLETVNTEVEKLAQLLLKVDAAQVQLKGQSSNWLEQYQQHLEEANIEIEESNLDTLLNTADILNQLNAAYQASTDFKLQLLQNEYEQGFISADKFDAKKRELLEKEAVRSKAMALFNIGIDTAQNIVKLAANPILQALAILAGFIQAGVVAATPIPKFKKGVVQFNGKGSETSDSNLAYLSKNESVITAAGTRQDVGLFKAANKLELKKYIRDNYVVPELMMMNKQKESMFSDYQIVRAINEGTYYSKINNKKLISAIKKKDLRLV